MIVNPKTAQDLHLHEILEFYQPYTAMGKKEKLTLFLPGDEEKWQKLMDEQAIIFSMIEEYPRLLPRLEKYFTEVPDVDPLLGKLSFNQNLTLTEWFMMKRFLWCIHGWMEMMGAMEIRSSFTLVDEEKKKCDELLQKLNPASVLHSSFSIESAYDERLQERRTALLQLENEMKTEQERMAQDIEQRYNVKRNPFGEWVVERGTELDILLRQESCLKISRETTYDTIYQLHLKTEIARLIKQAQIQAEMKAIEEEVMEALSAYFHPYNDFLQKIVEKVIYFDQLWARVRAARSWNGVKPTLSAYTFSVKQAFHPYVKRVLKEKEIACTPIDFLMEQGVAVIIGPNMGGKTVALKTVGVVALLAQLGFYVPATQCELPLFPWIGTVIHDDQQIQHGLSSYGAEIMQLQEWLSQRESGLLLIDELGRSTNPVEGAALAQAVTSFLRVENRWAVLVTHYKEVMEVEGVQGYRIAGISADLIQGIEQEKVPSTIQKLMDYRLVPIDPGQSLPEQALMIAELLGLDDQIIAEAKRLCGQQRLAGVGSIPEKRSRGEKDG